MPRRAKASGRRKFAFISSGECQRALGLSNRGYYSLLAGKGRQAGLWRLRTEVGDPTDYILVDYLFNGFDAATMTSVHQAEPVEPNQDDLDF